MSRALSKARRKRITAFHSNGLSSHIKYNFFSILLKYISKISSKKWDTRFCGIPLFLPLKTGIMRYKFGAFFAQIKAQLKPKSGAFFARNMVIGILGIFRSIPGVFFGHFLPAIRPKCIWCKKGLKAGEKRPLYAPKMGCEICQKRPCNTGKNNSFTHPCRPVKRRFFYRLICCHNTG